MSEDFSLDLNFDGVRAFVALDKEGQYTLEITDMDVKPPKKEGQNPQLILTFTVVSGGPMEGASTQQYFVLSHKALGYLKPVLEAATGQEWNQDGMALRKRDLVGRYVNAVAVIETTGGDMDPTTGEKRPIKKVTRLKNWSRYLGEDTAPDFGSMMGGNSGFEGYFSSAGITDPAPEPPSLGIAGLMAEENLAEEEPF